MLRSSIIVCSRNQSQLLRRTVASVLRQIDPSSAELLVVDNGSDDGSREALRALEVSAAPRLRVVDEPTVGLSVARNCGVRNARGRTILFLDDDAVPAPGWIDAYESALAAPGVFAAGGPVEPDFSGPLPGWLGERYLPYLSAWNLGPDPVDLRYNELPRGANMAFRREVFERVGEFDRRLGRAGRSLRSCEEIELGLRIERLGLRTVYVPGARVRHRVDASRLTPEWLARRFAAQGFSEAIVDWKHGGWSAARRGLGRFRLARDRSAGSPAADPHRAQFEGAGLRGYRRGLLYALAAVERWRAPSGETLLPYKA